MVYRFTESQFYRFVDEDWRIMEFWVDRVVDEGEVEGNIGADKFC